MSEDRKTGALGIVPGKKGGIALIVPGEAATVVAMPETEREVWDVIETAAMHARQAFIEDVASRPGQGVRSVFTFGRGYGFLRACLVACSVPFESVGPTSWQREFGLLKRKGESDKAKKRRHVSKAQELWPTTEIRNTQDGLADALLIAEWGRRKLHERALL